MYLQAIIAASLLQLRTCMRKYSTSVIPHDYVVQFLRQIKADNCQAWCTRYDNLHYKPEERVMKFPWASDTAVGDRRWTDTTRQIVQRRRVKSRWPRCHQQNNGSQGIHRQPIIEQQKKTLRCPVQPHVPPNTGGNSRTGQRKAVNLGAAVRWMSVFDFWIGDKRQSKQNIWKANQDLNTDVKPQEMLHQKKMLTEALGAF